MDLNTYYNLNFGQGSSQNSGGANALNMDNMEVNLKRGDDNSLPLVLPSLLESNSEIHGGNVILILDNNIQLSTHICFLTSSPVLKHILMNIEVRLEKVSCISLPGYTEKSVRQLLHFLHKGFVVFENSQSQDEFLNLCTSLKINPSVIKDFNFSENPEEVASAEVQNNTTRIKVPATTTNTNVDVNYEKASQVIDECDLENNYLENLRSPGSEANQESDDEETPEHISDFINQLTVLAKPKDELENPGACSLSHHNEIAGNDTTDTTEPLEPSSAKDVEDNMEIDNEMMADVSCQEDTFKMPDSFDIPSDYINEILPTKSLSLTVPNNSNLIKNINKSSSIQNTGTKKEEPVLPKKPSEEGGKLNFDEIFRDDMLDNDNRPVSDEVIQITYKKDSSSKRNQGIQGKINPIRDRKKMMAALFNDSESEEDTRTTIKTPSPTNLLNELEEKRNRMKVKLKKSSGFESLSKKKSSARDEVKKLFTPSSSVTKIRNPKNEDDDKFIVSDNDNEDNVSNISDDESEIESSESDADGRRKRLDDRKKKKGGDVLAWMSRRAKVTVLVQTSPKSYIQDMAQYRMRLLAEGESEESDQETPSSSNAKAKSADGSTSSDDSIPRGKRIRSALKSSSSDSEEDIEVQRRKRIKSKKKHKQKNLKIEVPEASFPVEDVVWTPAMYQKWDKMTTSSSSSKKKSGEAEASSSKHKKLQRSSSIDLKKSSNYFKQKTPEKSPKFQRSISSIDPKGSSSPLKAKPSSPWPSASALPKIPKLKKID